MISFRQIQKFLTLSHFEKQCQDNSRTFECFEIQGRSNVRLKFKAGVGTLCTVSETQQAAQSM